MATRNLAAIPGQIYWTHRSQKSRPIWRDLH